MVCQNRYVEHCGYTDSDKHSSHEHTSKHNSSPVFGSHKKLLSNVGPAGRPTVGSVSLMGIVRSPHIAPEAYLSFKAGMMFRSLKSMASDGTHICSPISVPGMSVIWCGPETQGFVNTTGSLMVTVTSSSP